MNFIVKLYDIFEKKSCSNCLAYIFFDHLKIFDHLAFDVLIFLQLLRYHFESDIATFALKVMHLNLHLESHKACT